MCWLKGQQINQDIIHQVIRQMVDIYTTLKIHIQFCADFKEKMGDTRGKKWEKNYKGAFQSKASPVTIYQ